LFPSKVAVTYLLNPETVKELCARIDESSLAEGDRILIKAVIAHHVAIGHALHKKTATIKKLLKMIFGAPTEKAETVLKLPPKPRPKAKPGGHGRKAASAYTGKKVTLSHTTLHSGDICPGCEKGKVYPSTPGVTVRITGNAPLDACVWEQEKLRCNLCGEIFTAPLPEGVGDTKYDETAGAMIALLKYGSGLPFNRLEEVQEGLGIPLPASTQWDIVEKNANRVYPAYKELIRQAAQGKVIHNDDTTMKILSSVNEKEGRSGTFTTGVLSLTDQRKIALFFTGHKHAGENLTDLLKERHPDRGPPIQMCDALSRNTSRDFAAILANCMAHARRNFVDVMESFPDECRHVITVLGTVYKNDATAREEKWFIRLRHTSSHEGP
jgi:transposase